jgi:hypothetical protein
MTSSTQTRTWVRVINALFALAVCAIVVGNYLPAGRVIGLARASLGIQGEWIGDEAKRITAVQPGGAADRAGLKPGDVLQFDSNRETDWVLAGYRHMPEGFRGSLPVRHPDGSTSIVMLAPERVTYLPTLNDKLALLARLAGLTLGGLIGVFMVWMRPGLMTWSLLFTYLSGFPTRVFADYYLGFGARPGLNLLYFLPPVTMTFIVAMLPFALTFPRNSMARWPWWRRAAMLVLALGWAGFILGRAHIQVFEGPVYASGPYLVWVVVGVLIIIASIVALARTYRRSDGATKARLRWALLGLGIAMVNYVIFMTIMSFSFVTADTTNGSQLTPGNWLFAVTAGVLFPFSFGYAVLRERVVDVQFALSRTLVFGVVSTLVVIFLAVLHWLIGRMIEHSGLAFGLEGLAAIGLGLVLHRASHGITLLVDRVLFRRHHQAEERLRRVTAALPFATDERSIADALVMEPVRNFDLASAALFYRESPEGPFNRVMAQGWSEDHAASLEADSFLVRYLQAEHAPLKLDDPQLLLAGVPEGAALPVLAIPIVNQHVLSAVVLYGAHANHTLLDPDEVELLHQLAKAAATSHQQVRIATLTREIAALTTENSALTREYSVEKLRNDRLEGSLRMLVLEGGQGRR